jgi:hypothetical protein
MFHAALFLGSLPTSSKILGVYGAVWLIVLAVAATAIFVRRMYHLVRILALGRGDNRLDHVGQRLWLFLKEVMGQSRFWKGDSIIRWAHPLIF